MRETSLRGSRIPGLFVTAVLVSLFLANPSSADVSSWPIGSGGGGGCSRFIAVDGAGNVYANDSDNGRVRKWSSSGSGGEVFGPPASADPRAAVKAPDGGIYIATPGGLVHYSSSGTPLGTVPLSGGPAVDLYRGLATDDAGNIYGIDTNSSQVVKYSPLGTFLGSWGTAGDGPGQFDFYLGRGYIAADSDGNTYVGDATNRIQMFNSSGTFLRQWGGSGSGQGQFTNLWGLAASADRRIYAGEFGSGPGVVGGIRQFTDTGGYLSNSNTFWQTTALATFGSNLVFQSACREINRYELTKPVVSLSVSDSLRIHLVGSSVRFEAQANVPFGTISRYDFDTNGDGKYEVEGSTSSVTTSFDSPGRKVVSVRVESNRGGTATAQASIEVVEPPPPPPAPPSGPVGISINAGAYATNEENVSINAVWPLGATAMLLSNDGGFRQSGGAESFGVTEQVPWKLATMSSGQLTRIVYARFIGDQTFSDDIVLDKTAPIIRAATASGLRGSAGTAKTRSYVVRLRAVQKRSGISVVQFSSKRSGGTSVVLKSLKQRGFVSLNKSVAVRAAKAPRFVRVRSAAGTWSKWKPISSRR